MKLRPTAFLLLAACAPGLGHSPAAASQREELEGLVVLRSETPAHHDVKGGVR